MPVYNRSATVMQKNTKLNVRNVYTRDLVELGRRPRVGRGCDVTRTSPAAQHQLDGTRIIDSATASKQGAQRPVAPSGGRRVMLTRRRL